MTIFTCTDTFEGILCGVYDAWMSRLGHENVCLELEGTCSIRMFAEYRIVEETEEKAGKVMDAIRRKAGHSVYEQVYCASLSCQPEKADRIYRYLITAFRFGRKVTDLLQAPEVYELFQMKRSVSNEALHLIEFIRFSQTEEGILAGIVAPRNDVIVLMAPHFADRLSEENWIIYDERRKKAILHRAAGPWMMVRLSDDSWRDRLTASGDQAEFEALWKTFHSRIAIAERENPICQRSHLPLRFRPYMTEFQDAAHAPVRPANARREERSGRRQREGEI